MKYFLSIFVWIVMACSREKQPEPILLSDSQLALHSIGNAVIIRSFLDLQNSVNAMNEFANSYVQDSTNTQKLLTLRREWINAVVSWKLSSIFLEGNFRTDIRSSNLYAPANTTAIENIISSNIPRFDPAYVNALEETSTGLSAIEFLIYGTDHGEPESVVSVFKTVGSRRGAYLRALCLDLKRRSDQLLFQWSIAGDGYINKFMASSNLERSSSLGLLTDNIISTISRIKEARIGLPLGANGAAQPQLVESRYSGESIRFIRAELQSVQQIFTGMRTTKIGQKGLNWLLDQADARSGNVKLSAAIEARFVNIYSKLEQIQSPLEQAVVINSKQVKEVYESIEELQQLLQKDMVTNLHFSK